MQDSCSSISIMIMDGLILCGLSFMLSLIFNFRMQRGNKQPKKEKKKEKQKPKTSYRHNCTSKVTEGLARVKSHSFPKLFCFYSILITNIYTALSMWQSLFQVLYIYKMTYSPLTPAWWVLLFPFNRWGTARLSDWLRLPGGDKAGYWQSQTILTAASLPGTTLHLLWGGTVYSNTRPWYLSDRLSPESAGSAQVPLKTLGDQPHWEN